MSVAPILRDVYAAYLTQWGKPSRAIEFEGASAPDATAPSLPGLDVFIWQAADQDDVTLFATIGMSATAMTGARHRAELHFAVLGPLSAESEQQAALYLANLSRYPFDHDTHLDWWHKIEDTGAIPEFTGFRAALLHPKFADTGLDTIESGEGLVKILNVVPLSPDEATKSPDALLKHFEDRGIDIFSTSRCAGSDFVPPASASQGGAI